MVTCAIAGAAPLEATASAVRPAQQGWRSERMSDFMLAITSRQIAAN